MSHPFEGTPQYEQQYGAAKGHHGHRIGRRANGLGSLWGSTGAVDEDSHHLTGRRPRMTSSLPASPDAIVDGGEWEDELSEDGEMQLFEALNHLTTRQAFVIGLRYGLRDCQPHKLYEVAAIMGVTTQAVSDIEHRALRALQTLLTRGM